ncbi:DNA repair and recombination protein RAD54B [Trichonephila inaurata madagascariensis]|uniref:DNA repair and recombination protein RAD54-like n=1 Tax=Trichonephila inaurata madagascariensis TaxID=2747483 RepID=A0A8X6YKC3_9ARAC|nr:DNA repair and recombination protein RAD54B [Trichonephila inaurata madagascariensis]
MRRSAAPSLQPAAKRLHFLPPLKNYELQIDKENELFSLWNSNSDNAVNSTSSEASTSEEKGLLTNCKQKSNNDMHTKEEFLKLLLEPVSQELEPDSKDLEKEPDFGLQITNNIDSSNDNLSHPHARTPKQTFNKICNNHEESTSLESVSDSSSFGKELHYNVLWCKRSSKKHKVWEGDGILIIKNRSALLKDSNGKVIDRGIGYKMKEIESLEDGSKFYIGGKECEIQYLMSSEECKNFVLSEVPERNITVKHDNNQSRTNLYPARKLVRPSLKFISPQHKLENLNSSIFEDDLILPSPTEEHQEMYNKKGLPIIPVRVERFLAKQLRVHQKEGIIFLYKCILGFQHEFGQGAILADEMGLGKTLQCIALIWTLCKQGPYGGKPILKTIIVITPSSLVTNWKKEFHKWLGEFRLTVYAVDKKHTVKDFIKTPKTVLIISYEMFSRSSNLLSPISFDLVICDEGHRIKNLNIKISNVVNCLKTNRRVLLTGTPIQNDLAEFFSIVDFVNPGALGSIQCFRRSFEKPIVQSRDPSCSEEEREIGEQRSEELNTMASAFMLRRTQEVINQFLPSKTEVVAFCRPTELQKKLYMHLLNTGTLWKLFSLGSSVDSSLQLVYISLFRKLCNHPSLLYSAKDFDDHHILNCIQSVFPTNYQPSPSDSGKMKVLEKMLAAFFTSSKKEKIVIVSCFTQTLNIIEELCRNKSYLYLRLDGSTTSSSRQDLVDVFNRSYTKYNIFLLSSKAGGVGFNLIGASRILLYDIDWNPANDLQAMARIWRDGQKHSVYIYRLLTTGTIEEKIYQRQISKQCLSGSVLNPGTKEKLKFSHEELKDLFTFHDDSECLTHDLINCDCLKSDFLEDCDKRKENDKASQKVGMEELLNWHHACGPINNSITSDSILSSGGNDITFMFSNTINSSVIK